MWYQPLGRFQTGKIMEQGMMSLATFGEMIGGYGTTIGGKVPLSKTAHAQILSYHSQHAIPRGKFIKVVTFVDTVASVQIIHSRGVEIIVGFSNGFNKGGR